MIQLAHRPHITHFQATSGNAGIAVCGTADVYRTVSAGPNARLPCLVAEEFRRPLLQLQLTSAR